MLLGDVTILLELSILVCFNEFNYIIFIHRAIEMHQCACGCVRHEEEQISD